MKHVSVDTILDQLPLVAPVSGLMVKLQDVPDDAFALGLVGDGVSIDPVSNTLVSPCAGEVTFVHKSLHAVTLSAGHGIEILLHVGLDTVTMRGEGFDVLVRAGDVVAPGQPLIRFDLGLVTEKARSLLTQMVVANGDRVTALVPATGEVAAGQDVAMILLLEPDSAAPGGPEATGATVTSPEVLVRNPAGLHARPAANLAALAKSYASDVTLVKGGQEVNAKSVTAVMGLEVGRADVVRVRATGPDAEMAVETICREIYEGLGEAVDTTVRSPAAGGAAPAKPAPRRMLEPTLVSEDPNRIIGVAAAPGVAVGTILQLAAADITVEELATRTRFEETADFNEALNRAKADLDSLETRMKRDVGAEKAQIFGAHRELLEDPELLDATADGIANGRTAGYAWKAAYSAYADMLARSTNEVLAGRATDIRDVGRRVLEQLTGKLGVAPVLAPNTIIVAHELTPSETAQLDKNKVVGFVTVTGGASSHAAIIAQSRGLPAVAGAEPRVLDLPNGTRAILDGVRGTVQVNAGHDEYAQVRAQQERLTVQRHQDLAAASAPAVTTDGHTVEVAANIGTVADAREAMGIGADGSGLLRSEFMFLDRADAPTEDEQTEMLVQMARVIGPGHKLVIRTLDVGGDKPLPYLPIPTEENPFLGERGIRVGLNRPEVLRPQLRAILRAAKEDVDVHVMFPMVATLDELRRAKAMLETERVALDAPRIPVGIMVEIPVVAMMADQFAREADFFSIGTNDLTQYSMAMDRGHPQLAANLDALNPGALALVKRTVDAAHARGRWVGVCGGIASDQSAVPILVGLGVDELSSAAPSVPAVKARIRRSSLAECQQLAARALVADSAADVRKLAPLE